MGATVNYNFGNITNLIYDYTDGIDFGTYLQNSSDYSGLNYTIASNLNFLIFKDYILKFHLSVTPKIQFHLTIRGYFILNQYQIK